MKYKNSFFQLEIKNNVTYLKIYPPKNDGKPLEMKEIVSFLQKKNIKYSSNNEIKAALENMGSEPITVKLCDEVIEAFDESAEIFVSHDYMVAYIRFYPPSTGGKVMSKKEIIGELAREKITYGIQDKVIDVFMMARQYCLNIPIAKGKKPILAEDTKIEYFFNTKPMAKPKMLEDGSVDFHALNIFTPVKKGDIVAKLTPNTLGEPGINVYGASVSQNHPKIKLLKYGRNITLSEDKTTLTSEVDGNITLSGDTVFVSDTYTVPADVDASTGDIEYEGNVLVTGNVRTGFSVKAKGDIQVNGVVEGAILEAGGNIVIKRGVQGMGKGFLSAGGDIGAQFFESATVKAEKDITVGSILHSNVTSGGSVIVSGKKGFIVGGEILCNNCIEVNSIGNKMETQTMIKVGVKPELYDEMKMLVTETNAINSQYDEISSYLNVYKKKLANGIKITPENLKQIKEYNSKLEDIEKLREERMERLKEIRLELELGKKGIVKVWGNTYVGTTIFIANVIYTVKEKNARTCYKVEGGEVVTKVL